MNEPTPPAPRVRRLRVRLACAHAAIVAFLALWIVVPAPLAPLYPLAVGAVEVGHWLALAALIALVVAAPRSPARRTRLAALALAAAALVLAMTPLARFPDAARAADAAFAAGFGDAWRSRLTPAAATALTPRRYALADALTGIDLPGIAPRERTYIGGDGQPLGVDIYVPTTPGPHAVVAHFHSGGWSGGTRRLHAALDRWLAGRDFVVMAFSYRLAPAHRYPAAVDDARAALAWARAHAGEHGGDGARLVAIGHSAGAQLAMLAGYEPGSGARAVATFYGPIDLDQGWRVPPRPDPLDVRHIIETYIGGTPAELPVPYREGSPISRVAPGLPPTLIIQGGRDHVVLVGRTREMAAALRAAGSPAALIEIPWAEHAFDAVFDGPSNQLALYHLDRFLAWALADEPPR
ncbi:MAG TPA: alpha/beta hydrolase [Planctomycetota bacterium]|nr:alpha/beta hydrolase [Planctomycetota bacterium]